MGGGLRKGLVAQASNSNVIFAMGSVTGNRHMPPQSVPEDDDIIASPKPYKPKFVVCTL